MAGVKLENLNKTYVLRRKESVRMTGADVAIIGAGVAKRAPEAMGAPSNDLLFKDLEDRYGGAFAQWVLDHLARTK